MSSPLYKLRLFMLTVASTAVVAGITVSSAQAATFTVTNTNDSGPGSLRQAVADSNLAPGPDTIAFSVTGTIRLTSGMLVVNGDLTIDGPGAGVLTVSGNRASRIIAVTFSSPPRLEIHDITLADGFGGAIVNAGGTVDVGNTRFSGNGSASAFGGAIQNLFGTVTITDSTFAGNSAFAGGAIENSNGGTLTVARSTFSGNSALPGARSPTTGAPPRS